MFYLFLKWLHIVAVISWMAGILYLYRLLVYEAERGTNQDIHELLSLMARRLYRYITLPAMLIAFAAGLSMVALNPGLAATGWFHIKFTCVLGLAGVTVYANQLLGRLEKRASNAPSSRYLRLLNEVPTLLMLIIVAMVVFRPF